MTDPKMKAVDDLLAEVADTRPDVPDMLMGAILRDAAGVQREARLTLKQGLWATLLDIIGGWPAVSGLAAAGVTGVWIGIAPPAGLETATSGFWGETEQVDLFGSDPLSVFAIDGEG